MPFSETICAPATPAGRSALAIVRVSGPKSLGIIQLALGVEAPRARFATLANYESCEGVVLDQVLFTYFPEGSSYTGEDLLEISLHGNPLIVEQVMRDLVVRGCRMAEAGEFTRTAYMNKKLTLDQAEGVRDVIHAESEAALSASRKQLQGHLSELIERFRERLIGVIAEVEAFIDFPEDDLGPEVSPESEIKSLATDVEALINTQKHSERLKGGIKAVIIGAPNAGKSTLLNGLLGRPRAITSDVPGTTRDYISEVLEIGGHRIEILDTAGVHETPDEIEAVGIEMTKERVMQAHIRILVVDSSGEFPTLPASMVGVLGEEDTVIVLNKSDLPSGCELPEGFGGYECVRTCLLERGGMGELKELIISKLENNFSEIGNQSFIINARHRVSLEGAYGELVSAHGAVGVSPELTAQHLYEAKSHLEGITGEISNERILDALFKTFCIGK